MEAKHTNKKWHAVEYAGVISIQDTSYYEESNKCNLLDFDYVGKETAEANGKLAAFAPELLSAVKRVLSLKDLIEYDDSTITEQNSDEARALRDMIKMCEFVIQKATTL